MTQEAPKRKNKVYELLKREMEIRAKRPAGKEDPRNQVIFVSQLPCSQAMFVDKSRNAAVNHGDRDLKSDVKSKQRRDRWPCGSTLQAEG